MIRVCTGWSPKGREQYGLRFLKGFTQFWAKDVQLQVYVEEPDKALGNSGRMLWDIPGARDCAVRYDTPAGHGSETKPNWKESCRRLGYNYRFDAFKFFRQILIPQAASLDMADGDILIWLDGDVETIAPVDAALVTQWLGDADVCFLGREPKHSEIGFWAIRLGDFARLFLADIATMYTSGAVLDLKEWHSAFVWDYVRRQSQMKQRDMMPGGRGHVFPISPVGRCLRHDKGKRKPMGTRG